MGDRHQNRLPDDRRVELDSPACPFIPEGFPLTDPRKERITVRHLLTMTSGIPGEVSGVAGIPTATEHGPFEHALGRCPNRYGRWTDRLAAEPGTHWEYSDPAFAHLALAFASITRPGHLVVLSPHDDDGLLGAGYAIQAARANGGEVTLLILGDGSAGYSTPEEKEMIVATRRAETLAAYRALGLDRERVLRCDYPDFGLAGYLGRRLPDGSPGTWGNFSPEDALVHARSPGLGANWALLASPEAEARVVEGHSVDRERMRRNI